MVPGLHRFGLFELNTGTRQLHKQGQRVRLQEQPLRVLEILLERPGELVTREELKQRLWPSDVYVDSELGLNGAIKRLRLALGDSADNPRFIETVPKYGYRFLAPVQTAGLPGLTAGEVGHSSSIVPGSIPPPPAFTMRKGCKIALVLFSLVTVALGLMDLGTIRLGRAGALAYSNYAYKPQDTEVKYFLSRFCQLHYRRHRYTIKDDFSKSLSFLEGTLAGDIIDAYKENDVINSFLTDPSKPEIDIEVKNIALEAIQNPPYKARVDFYMVYYSPADHRELKRSLHTVNFVFVFKTTVPNELTPINPLGLTVTHFSRDEVVN